MDSTEFISWLKIQKKKSGRRRGSNLSELTIIRYEQTIKKIPDFDFFNTPQEKLFIDMQTFLNSKPPLYAFVLRTYIKMLENKHLDKKMTLRALRTSLDPSTIYASVITNEEMARVLKLSKQQIRQCIQVAKTTEYKLFVQLLYDTACRITEICSIRVNDINFENKSITVRGKGGLKRPVKFEESTMQKLKSACIAKNLNDKLFKFNQVMGWRIIHNLGKEIGVVNADGELRTISPHSFRHSRLSHLAEVGWTAEKLKEYAGWSTIKMTDTYVHLRQVAMETGQFYKSTDLWQD
jgi:integrase/recombinase XerD